MSRAELWARMDARVSEKFAQDIGLRPTTDTLGPLTRLIMSQMTAAILRDVARESSTGHNRRAINRDTRWHQYTFSRSLIFGEKP